jgi:phage/plasmid-like protein (TIGR03299 family)
VQNADAFAFFKKFCAAGQMKMETAGSLWGGRYVWALARVGKDFTVGADKKDEVRPYILLMSPHSHGKSLIIQYTTVRVVCWNTLSMALGSDLKGNGRGFRMPHTRHFEFAKTEAEAALGLAIKQSEDFKEAAALLSKKKATKAKTEEFFLKVLKAKEDAKKAPVMLPKFRAALEHAPGQQTLSAKGTWWGALNAVTYIVDHSTGSSRDTALKGAWLGNHANTKRRALELALDYAK